MELWSEMRTAMMVARLGTVRAAADELGLHRATVSRHIDVLEQRLGTKLFLRHKNGYTATRAGRSLHNAAESANALISSFIETSNVDQQDPRGELTISGLNRVLQHISPAICSFRAKYPGVRINLNAESRLTLLEEGEADVALRIGAKPDNLDYVPVPLQEFSLGIFGHRSYFDAYGTPECPSDLEQHPFIAQQFPDGRLDIVEYLGLPAEVARLVVNNPVTAIEQVRIGAGLGITAHVDAKDDPDLIEVLQGDHDLTVTLWMVTHVDAHRSCSIQRFVRHLKTEVQCLEHRPRNGFGSR